ncbi:unnamed protein product [Callosobruchus maculatus]|uniref:BTB domain-containing protein n=1 Tax=Callosobruchus maculatus TaxID=64391 RepID=A0A653BFF4_CALMS|nr:unnamed protein product [Callosobruchus maculatus]
MEEEEPTGSQRYCLRWNNYTNNILQMISQHHLKEKFVDVVLVCEYHYVKVHRLILSACSMFFEALLDSQVGHVFQPYIVLTGVKFEHLKYILDFMYTGEIKALDKDIEEILALGEKLKVKGLCSVVLREKISINPQGPPTNIDTPIKPVPVGIDTPPIAKKESSFPSASMPDVPLQQTKVPSATLPKVPPETLRKVPPETLTKVPSATLPNVPTVTQTKVPSVTLPKVPPETLTKVPSATLPNVPSVTQTKLSSVTLPKVPPEIPTKVPSATLPKVPPETPTKVPSVTPPKVPSATLLKLPPAITSTPNERSVLKKGITSVSHTPVPSVAVDNKETVSGVSTPLSPVAINVTTSPPKLLPKIQVRHPSVINATATARCDEISEGVTQTTTESSNAAMPNKQITEKSKRIELSIVSSGQKSATNILKVSAKQADTLTFTGGSREAGTSAESSVMPKDSVIPKAQKQTTTPPIVAAQSDIVFDISKRTPAILKKGIKRKLTSSNTFENVSGSSDPCVNKTVTEVKFSPSKQRVIEVKTIKSKTDVVPNKPAKTEPTSTTEIRHEQIMPPEKTTAVKIGDEAMVVAKEETLDLTSNRTVLIRDRVDVMKNGTQVPKKVLDEEQKKSVNPFMMFANEWRGKIASENPGESKREISLRISQMWKSLDPDSRRTYYRRARQAVKGESTSTQSMERKPMDENVTVTDPPKDGPDIEIIICGDEED